MQYLDDDMDELLRRAAEDYPLNTRSASWETVQAKLSSEEAGKPAGRRSFLWLLLLLPVTLICNHITNGVYKTTATANVATAARQWANNQPAAPNSASDAPAAGWQQKTPVTKRSVALQKRQEKKAAIKTRAGAEMTSVKTIVYPSPNTFVQPALQRKVQQPAESADFFRDAVASAQPRHAALELFPPAGEHLLKRSNSLFGSMPQPLAKTAEQQAAGRRRFYAGVVAGPDLSTVRFEKFSEAGLGAGIVLGYQLGNRLTVEAGALSSKKYYYSEGGYLNTKKLSLPANAKILSVNGDCRMLELPLVLQYMFRKKEKHAWYAAAGVSSYLMKKEVYTYDYLYTNTGTVVPHQKTYDNQTRNWLSVVQLSAGYTSGLGSVVNLRFEPYYTLPLKGIGYGELPLSSLGLRVGITSKRF